MIWGARKVAVKNTTMANKKELRRLLADTALAGRKIVELSIPGSLEVALATPITADELEVTWRAARALVPVTGRWPVAVVSWLPEGDWEKSIRSADIFSRFYFQEADPPFDATMTLAVAGKLTPEDVDAFVEAARDECLEFEAEHQIEIDPTYPAYEPWHRFTEPAALVFLPWSNGWDSLAYINFYDSASRGIPETIALARRWETRYVPSSSRTSAPFSSASSRTRPRP